MGLIGYVARRVLRQHPAAYLVAPEDAVQAGVEAVLSSGGAELTSAEVWRCVSRAVSREVRNMHRPGRLPEIAAVVACTLQRYGRPHVERYRVYGEAALRFRVGFSGDARTVEEMTMVQSRTYPDPLGACESRGRAEDVRRALERIPVRYGLLLRRIFMEGAMLRDIAEEEGVVAQAVGGRKKRALAALGRALAGEQK